MDLLKLAFILALVLIGVAYFAGLTHDIDSFTAGANKLLLTLTGRNQQGQFANYPNRP